MMEEKVKTNVEVMEEVKELKRLIDYQDKAVVSKMLLNRRSGNITLFAFDENEGLSEHTSAYDALVYCVEGKCEINIGGKLHVLSEGELIIMPANKPHSVKALSKFKMLLIMIKESSQIVASYH